MANSVSGRGFTKLILKSMRQKFKEIFRARSNTPKNRQKWLATLLAKVLHQRANSDAKRSVSLSAGLTLHAVRGGRKYLNITERRRYALEIERMAPEVRTFGLVLMWSGCRVSEALAVTPLAVDRESGTITLITLKRRKPGHVRQVPLPTRVIEELTTVFDLKNRERDPKRAQERLWTWSRSTAWRHVKKIMRDAGIYGPAAMPKGLRHSFGVAAFESVPPHIVQRWLGHASLRTTAIYGQVIGREERTLARRLWKGW
jgi:integrase